MPRPDIGPTLTYVVFPSGADQEEYSELALGTNNDRQLTKIGRGLADKHRKYALALRDIEDFWWGLHSDDPPEWVDSGDKEFAAAVAAYFEREIRPLLADPLVEFLGEISGRAKFDLLAGARALLFPIDWPEPFGLVMIEALACGTPVIAWPCGSVPEIIEDGVTGFVAGGMDAAVRAVDLEAEEIHPVVAGGEGAVVVETHQEQCAVTLVEQVDVLDQDEANAAAAHDPDDRGHPHVDVPAVHGIGDIGRDDLRDHSIDDGLQAIGARCLDRLERTR